MKIKELAQQNDIKMEWISVKDKMPEMNIAVLAFDVIGDITVSHLEKESFDNELTWYIVGSCCGCKTNDVIYWMPLPEKPKS